MRFAVVDILTYTYIIAVGKDNYWVNLIYFFLHFSFDGGNYKRQAFLPQQLQLNYGSTGG